MSDNHGMTDAEALKIERAHCEEWRRMYDALKAEADELRASVVRNQAWLQEKSNQKVEAIRERDEARAELASALRLLDEAHIPWVRNPPRPTKEVCSVVEYDGAYKCLTHGKVWGAVTFPNGPCAVTVPCYAHYPSACTLRAGHEGPCTPPTKDGT